MLISSNVLLKEGGFMVISRVVVDSKVMLGKPVIKGTRITVEILLKKLAQNLSPVEILKDYPQLTEADIKAAVDYAAATVEGENIYPVPQK